MVAMDTTGELVFCGRSGGRFGGQTMISCPGPGRRWTSFATALTAALTAFMLLAVVAEASSRRPPRASLSVAVLPAKAPSLLARVGSAPGAICSLTVKAGPNRQQLLALVATRRGLGAWRWEIPADAPSGRWSLTARCRSGHVRSSARRTVGVTTPTPAGSSGELIAHSTLIVARGRPRAERVRGRAGAAAASCRSAPCNTYPWGQCTWFTKKMRPDLPNFPGVTGDARFWASDARARGFPVDANAQAGDAVVFQPGQLGAGSTGHVAYVTSVTADGRRMGIAEDNWNERQTENGSTRSNLPTGGLQFIHHKGQALPPPPPLPINAPPGSVTGPTQGPLVGGQGTDSGLWVHQAGAAGFRPLAGSLNGPPAIVSVGAVTYYIVSGSDHRVYLRTDDMSWGVLSGASIYCDYVSAAVNGSTLIVACKGSDGHLYQGTTAILAGQRPALIPYFSSLGGMVTNGTAVAVVNGQPTYFVNGATATNGRNVYARTDSTDFTLMDYSCNGGPALASRGSVAYFACAGLGDAVYWAQNTGSGWGAGYSLGGAGRGTAALAMAPDNTATVFVEGSDNGVHFNTIPSGNAGTWQHLGGYVTGGVGAAEATTIPGPAGRPPPGGGSGSESGYRIYGSSTGVFLRSGPGYSFPRIGGLEDGTPVRVACQTRGSYVATSNIWDRIDGGSYVSDYYVNTPGVGTLTPGIGQC